jgi:hypothetical protein
LRNSESPERTVRDNNALRRHCSIDASANSSRKRFVRVNTSPQRSAFRDNAEMRMAQGFLARRNCTVESARVGRMREISSAKRAAQTNDVRDVHRPTFFHRMVLRPRAKTGFATESERISAK